MLSYLNASETANGTGRNWKSMVYWPRTRNRDGAPVLKPSALRLYRDEKQPDAPTTRVYDVYEGYWSPLSKNKTNVVSMLRWLLSATFLATSSTARILAMSPKLRWDFGYLLAVLAAIALLLARAVAAGLYGWHEFAGIVGDDPAHPPSFAHFVTSR
jgi:hypothetical protein